MKKEAIVLIIGRPNVGKSTFVNNLIGQKVAITSPKPQTTRFSIQALYQEERGNLLFIDTPGIFGSAEDFLSKKINKTTLSAVNQESDLILYFIDPTRRRDFEEAKVLGIIRKIKKPKILVFNKSDQKAKYLPQYKFLEEEFDKIFYISALEKKHLKPLVDKIFELLPEKNKRKLNIPKGNIYPAINIDSKIFVSELIREKVFLMMSEEIPYTTMVLVSEITERDNGVTYIKAEILTTDNRYKKMLIGKGGRRIKEIGSFARKEIALAINKKVYLDLTVRTDRHWQETYYQ